MTVAQRPSVSMILLVLAGLAGTMAQSVTETGPTTASPLSLSTSTPAPVPIHTIHIPPGAIAGIVIGVCLIVVASYFCCCHAACTAPCRERRARNLGQRGKGNVDLESQTHSEVAETRASTDKTRTSTHKELAATDEGVKGTNGSVDEPTRDDDDVRSTSTAPPRYEDS
ncbi:hypothetical protein B0H11DRAFT_2132159 [Mycena galericulata]|nr:hypothetical protein B0H11DRAFT_2132159 [Mycena galericulata]